MRARTEEPDVPRRTQQRTDMRHRYGIHIYRTFRARESYCTLTFHRTSIIETSLTQRGVVMFI